MMASGSLSCPLCCQQNLGSVVALQEHLLYLMYRPLSCPVCQVMFSGLQALVQHLQQHLEINLNEEEAQQLPKLLVEGNNQKLTMQNSLPVFKSKAPSVHKILTMCSIYSNTFQHFINSPLISDYSFLVQLVFICILILE